MAWRCNNRTKQREESRPGAGGQEKMALAAGVFVRLKQKWARVSLCPSSPPFIKRVRNLDLQIGSTARISAGGRGRAAAEPDARPRPRLQPGRAAALLSRPKGHVGWATQADQGQNDLFFFWNFFYFQKSETVKENKKIVKKIQAYFFSYRKLQTYLWTILFRYVLWYFYLYIFLCNSQLIMKPTWIN